MEVTIGIADLKEDMKNKTLRLFKAFGIAALTCGSVFLSCATERLEFDEKTFYKEWAAWEDQGIADYSVKKKYEMYSPEPYSSFYLLIVKDNVLFKVESLDEKNSDHGGGVISQIYEWIKVQYESNKRGSIKVTYNKDFHFPETAYFDLPPKNPPYMLGTGALYLSEFTPLPAVTEE